MGFFDKRVNTTTLEPMLSDEQIQAMQAILGYGKTGELPSGYKAGEAYDLSGFDFGTSGAEKSGMSQLMGLTGTPQGIDTARKTLTSLTDLNFAPDDQSTGLGAFKKSLARQTKNASDVLNRESAITGSRFGTQIAKEKTDLGAQQSEQLGLRLADLFNAQQNRALSASQALTGLEGTNENIAQNRIAALFNYGGFERDLANQKAQLEYSEKQRQRDEQLQTLTGFNTLFNRNLEWGQKSITTESPSMFMSMFGEINPVAGSYNTHRYGYTTNQSSLKDIVDLAMQASKAGATGGMGGGLS